VAWPFLAYTVRAVEFFAQIPGAVWIMDDFNLFFVILAYLALFGLTLSGPRLTQFVTPALIIAALAVGSVLVWRTTLSQPDGRLHVTFLSVGSGDAILIQNPAGRFLLINGGPSPSKLSDQLGRRMPPFDRALDYLVIASTQENQVAALPRTLERFPPRKVLWAGNEQASFSSRALDEWLTRYNIRRQVARANDEIDLGQGAKLRVLAVSERGAILLVEWGSFRVVLPVGSNFEMLKELNNGQAFGQVTALLLAESGYLPVNPPEWLDNLQSPLNILSVSAGDPNGLPSPALLDALEKINLVRTDVNGWIDLSTDGKQVWFETEKK
jgi:competence protein ComEC